MSPQLPNILLILMCKTLLLQSSAFNLKLTEDAAKFLVSPVIQEFGRENTSSQPLQLPNNVNPSFYSYSLNMFTAQNGSAGIEIGSPKMIDSNNSTRQNGTVVTVREPKGGITLCVVDANATFSTERSVSCEESSLPIPQRGDNFGAALSIRPDGNTLACSTTRIQDCEKVRYIPGRCFKSTNFGKTWDSVMNAEKELNCPVLNVEVLFVLDGSGSVGKKNFETVKNWVKDISQKVGLEEERVTVGVVQYSHYWENQPIDSQEFIVTEIEIGKYRTNASFAAAVDKISLHGYETFTGRALQKVLSDFKNTENYGYVTTKQVMILLTDGKATDPKLVPVNAEILRGLGVIPYAVGVGSQRVINRAELRLIANGDPTSDNRVFMSAGFAGLDAIAKELEAEIGGLVLEGQGDLNKTGNEMQFGQSGFSIAYSKDGPKTVSADASPYRVTAVEQE